MAWVPKYFYDVFLSYAHADNEGREEWVGSFKTELEFRIRANLGAWGGRGATVWWDEHGMRPGDSIRGTIIDALDRSAAVVSLCSPHYLSSGYCMDELAAFETACARDGGIRVGNASRLLNAILRPREDVRQFASAPGSLHADFSSGGAPLAFGCDAFKAEMERLALALANLLTAMRERFPAVYVSLPVETENEAGQNTKGMLESLSRAGYRRTSEHHPGGLAFPALTEEIHGALLSVHIVDDPASGLTVRQIEAARGADKPILVWLSERARRSDRADGIRTAVAGRGRECCEGLFSEFRDRVMQLLPRIEKGEWPEPRQSVRGRKTVLFLYNARTEANEPDSAPRRVLRRLENDFDVKRIGGPTDETDGVLVYQQDAADRWFENKLGVVKDMRGVKAAWPVPPPDKGTAERIASDFKFRPAPEFSIDDKRLLLTTADPDPLGTFIEFVNRSPA
jgi:hypothetical protein